MPIFPHMSFVHSYGINTARANIFEFYMLIKTRYIMGHCIKIQPTAMLLCTLLLDKEMIVFSKLFNEPYFQLHPRCTNTMCQPWLALRTGVWIVHIIPLHGSHVGCTLRNLPFFLICVKVWWNSLYHTFESDAFGKCVCFLVVTFMVQCLILPTIFILFRSRSF